MIVLSLFDGMSCGQIALNRAGIYYSHYFASEIDKYAISVAKHNYPDTHHIGDVTQVKASDLPPIDLLIGGSPCQGFSFAGKQLNFDDPRSVLFFEFVRLLKEIQSYNPNVLFLLENVKMKKEYQDVISELLGVEPVKINSALVSAQNRERLYWSNIPVSPLTDKGILLKHIVEDGFVDRDKSLCLTQRYCGFAGSQNYLRRRYFGKSMGQAVFSLSPTLQKEAFLKDPRADFENIGIIRSLTVKECEKLQTVDRGYVTGVSEHEAKRMLGNGWTVDVIAEAFFKHLDLLC